MKILLVDPPFQRFIGFYRFYFPLGLTYIAAILKQSGHDVLIYDAEHDQNCVSPTMIDTAMSHGAYQKALNDDSHLVWNEFTKILIDFKPQIVGISVLSVKILSAAKIISLVKRYDKSIIVIAGGDHVTVRPHDILKYGADYVICGEGELGIAYLLQKICNGESPHKILNPVFIEEIDTLPLPAIECLHNISSYRPIDLGLMITARGCPFCCAFCGLSTMWGNKIRLHSIDRVMMELKLRKERYGVNYFSFRNGTFTIDRRQTIGLCRRIINDSLDIKWECLTRVDRLDDELLKIMIDAGCDTIRIGVESGSERILRYMNKHIFLDQVRTAAKLLNSVGIYWSAYFMLGVPVETEESIAETLNFIKEIEPPFVTLARFTPLPGTPMYQEVIEAGLIDEEKTNWSWAANQNIDLAFVNSMPSERFLELMGAAAQFVKKYNSEKVVGRRSDARLK